MSERPDYGTVLVRRTAYGRPPEEREHRIPVPVFETPHVARVGIGMTSTRKVSADMEFMKIEVRVELPCLPNDGDIRDTVTYATGLIDEIVNGPEGDRGAPVQIASQVPTHTPGTPIA